MVIDKKAVPGADETPRAPQTPAQPASLIRDWLASLCLAYQRKIVDRNRVDRFWATIAFGIGTLVRVLTFGSLLRGDDTHFEILGVHVHHMVPGILMVLATGVVDQDRRTGPRVACLFGAGTALLLAAMPPDD